MYFSDSTRPSDVMVKVITPKEAKKMLGSNYKNQRRLKPTTLQKFETDIKAGRWNPYRGDLVRVSEKGTLIDGQHRLQACVNTNEPIAVLYKEGFDEEEFVYLDSGKTRTNADSLGKIKLASIVSIFIHDILAYEKYGLDMSSLNAYRASNAEIAAAYRPVYSDYAAETAKLVRYNFKINRSAVAFFFWLADQVDPGYAAKFREDLSNELVIDESVAKFRNTLGTRLQKGANFLRVEILALLVDTWNGYVTGKPMKKLTEPRTFKKLYMIGLNATSANYTPSSEQAGESDE